MKTVERFAAERMSKTGAMRTIVEMCDNTVPEPDRLRAGVHELQAQLKLMNDKNETTNELSNAGDR